MERGHSVTKHDVLRDYCDGEFFQQHPLFSLHHGALQILFYYDDVEVCNPLGSKKKKHKMGKVKLVSLHCTYKLYDKDIYILHSRVSYEVFMSTGFFYFLLGNIHPKYRSCYQMIQLAAICKTENVVKYSLDAVLQPIIADIKKLVCCIESSLFYLYSVISCVESH